MNPLKPLGAIILSMLLGVLFSIPPARGDSSGPAKDEESGLLALARLWADAVGQNKPELLDSYLDDQYVHIHGTGLVETKSQFLEALRTGARKYGPIQLEELRVRTFAGFALVTGKFSLRVEARGKVIEGVNRFCMTLVRRPAGWAFLQFQATALPPKP